MTKPDLDLLVIGGGVSGLTVAREARRLRPNWKVRVLEADARPGGTMRSDRVEGCLCEWGPNGFLDNAALTLTLVRRLGLEERQVQAREEAAIRYIFRNGQLRRVPDGPKAFLKSDILSPWGKLRVLAEPLIPNFWRAPTKTPRAMKAPIMMDA